MDNLDFNIERQILKLGNQLIVKRNSDLKNFNLTSNLSETILFFDLHDGAMMVDLKEYLKVSHQAAQKIVEKLKKKGLVYVTVSEKDARAKNVYLTAEGRQLCDTLKSSGGAVGRDLLSRLSEAEKHTLFQLLSKLTLN